MIVLEDKSFYAIDLILTITQIIILVIHEILGIKCMTLFTYSKEIKILKKGDYSREQIILVENSTGLKSKNQYYLKFENFNKHLV